jgi:hypothetical protein
MYIIDKFVVSIEYELIIEIIITFVGIEQDRSTTFHIVNLKRSHALWDIPFGQRARIWLNYGTTEGRYRYVRRRIYETF